MHYVLDASTILAWLKHEPGWEKVTATMDGSFSVSAANYAEVVSKLVDEKVPMADIDLMLEEFVAELVPVSRSIARLAGQLRRPTRDKGLSLGDRLCLATALNRAANGPVTAITADRSWTKLQLDDITVASIR